MTSLCFPRTTNGQAAKKTIFFFFVFPKDGGEKKASREFSWTSTVQYFITHMETLKRYPKNLC